MQKIKIKNSVSRLKWVFFFAFVMLCSIGQAQNPKVDIVNELVESITSMRSKNFNFGEVDVIVLEKDQYEVPYEDEKLEITGSGVQVFLQDFKANKQITSAEKVELLDRCFAILESHGYTEVFKASDLSLSSYRVFNEKDLHNYVLIYIPKNSDEELEILYLQKRLEYEESYIRNPSFESESGKGSIFSPERTMLPLSEWFACGSYMFSNEAFYTVYDEKTNRFGPAFPPSDGATYITMVTRENKSWTSASQHLQVAFKAGTCYVFDIDLRHEPEFYSGVNGIHEKYAKVSFGTPICLTIGLSHTACDFDQEIYFSEPVDHSEWTTYTVGFSPNSDYDKFVLKASYCVESYAYNGNIMIDNIRNFREVGCKVEGGK